MGKNEAIVVRGSGQQVVKCACSAVVNIIPSNGDLLLLVGGKVARRLTKLPDDVDEVEVVTAGDTEWVLRWWPSQPAKQMCDPTPIAIPAGAMQPESLEQTIARMVRRQVSLAAQSAGFDPEEEDDFDDDDAEGDFDDALTPYEFEEHGAQAEAEQQRLAKLGSWLERKRAERKAARAGQDIKPEPVPSPSPADLAAAPKSATG